ncbi:hypothetical protein DLN99_23280 [Salmonella enterica]|nr:hypothetical protein [Salmonella enterica]
MKAGQGGEWLLDPADITIVTDASNSGIFESGKGTSSGGESETAFILSPNQATSSKVSATKINEKLNEGTNVTIKTLGTHTPDEATTQGGNITVSAGITKSSGADASLTLEADKNITSATGKLNVNLLGAGSSDGKVLINAAHQCQRRGCECAP